MKKLLILGVGALMVGCTSTLPQQYQCDDLGIFNGMISFDEAMLEINGETRTLKRVRSASGAKYELDEPYTLLFAKGGEALIEWNGKDYRNCQRLDRSPDSSSY